MLDMMLLLARTSVSLGCRVAVVVLHLLIHRLESLYVGFAWVQVSHVATYQHSLKGEKINGLSPEIASNSR